MKKIAVWLVTIVGVCLIIIYVIPSITRFGFCHDWWLKETLWSHFLWQCTCAPEFEQSLFQDNVEIVVSACQSPQGANMSTDGQYMIVTLLEDNQNTSYITQLATGQERPWPYTNFTSSALDGFWTETLFLAHHGTQGAVKLIDVTDFTELNLIVSTASPMNNGFELQVPEEILQAMKRSSRVIMHRTAPATLILADDAKHASATNYLLHYEKHHISSGSVDELLAKNEITFQTLTRGGSNIQNFHELISYNGFFSDRTGDIYTVDRQKVTEIGEVTGHEYQPIPIGWAPDNSGVYYLLQYKYGLLAGSGLTSWKLLPGPIIKLNVP